MHTPGDRPHRIQRSIGYTSQPPLPPLLPALPGRLPREALPRLSRPAAARACDTPTITSPRFIQMPARAATRKLETAVSLHHFPSTCVPSAPGPIPGPIRLHKMILLNSQAHTRYRPVFFESSQSAATIFAPNFAAPFLGFRRKSKRF